MTLIFKVLLEGLGYGTRRLYYSFFRGSVEESDKAYSKTDTFSGLYWNLNIQVGVLVVAILFAAVYALYS